MLYIFSRLVSRQPTEIIDIDSAINKELTKVRKYNWARFWLISAWLNVVYCIIFWLGITGRISFMVFMLSTLIYIVAVLWAAVKGIYHARGKLYLNPKEPPFLMFKTKRGFFIINLHQEVLDFKQNMSL